MPAGAVHTPTVAATDGAARGTLQSLYRVWHPSACPFSRTSLPHPPPKRDSHKQPERPQSGRSERRNDTNIRWRHHGTAVPHRRHRRPRPHTPDGIGGAHADWRRPLLLPLQAILGRTSRAPVSDCHTPPAGHPRRYFGGRTRGARRPCTAPAPAFQRKRCGR